MNVIVKDMPALRLCGVRHLGPHELIPEAFSKLADIAGPAGLCSQTDITLLCVLHDDPNTTAQSRLRSDAAIVVADTVVLPLGVAELRLPAGPYACATHVGPYTGLRKAWDRLIREWLPKSGHRMAPGLRYALYPTTLLEVPPHQVRTELYLPLDGASHRSRTSLAPRQLADGYEVHEGLLPISLLVTRRTLRSSDVPGVFEYYR
jgi:AraC family transcriptional regulator